MTGWRFCRVTANIEIKRLALNMDQVEKYGPPPNFAKKPTVARRTTSPSSVDKSWELDALEPRVIEKLIRREIKKLIDQDPWNEDEAQEAADKARLTELADTWT